MAKKTQNLTPLTMTEIILRGDAETIRQALEARTQIDEQLEEREAAYRRIAELEAKVCEIVGEDGTFPFPEPPMPVATFAAKTAPKKKTAAKPKPEAKAEPTPAGPDTKEPAEKAPADQSADKSPDAPKPDDA